MKLTAGNHSTSSSGTRQVTLKVTGMTNNDCARSSDMEIQVPFTRLTDTLRLMHRLGGKITNVNVSGERPDDATPAAKPAGRKSSKKAANSSEG